MEAGPGGDQTKVMTVKKQGSVQTSLNDHMQSFHKYS